QERRRASGGKPLGIGFSTYIEACGLAPSQVVGALGAQAGLWESAKVRVHPSGSVSVFVGTKAQGQGHKTTYAQIVADRLGIDIDSVEIREGDTGEVQFGMGTYGSRSAAVGGSAVAEGVDRVIAKGRRIAAHLMEASEDDIVFEEGRYQVRGGDPTQGHSFGEVALQAYLGHNLPEGMEPGMEESAFYDPPNFTFPFGSHVAVVEVDPETGEIEVLRYVAVDDCGNVINPMIVEGQVHGGVVHGLGQALWEEALYDQSGQMVSATLLDYALPRAHKLVSLELDRTTTPCPHNPLGVKGIGEAGAIASPAALVNAVLDALRPFSIRHLEMPLTPEKVWNAIHRGEGQ
ncbi:MAG: molybdopterin-dependent oxidoreductase, partial [Acidobacteriota bacterium]